MSEWDALLDEPLSEEEEEFLAGRGITPCTPGAINRLLDFRARFEHEEPSNY